MADYHRRGLLFLADPTKALEEFRNWLRNDIQSAEYKRDVETGVLQFVDDVISKKIELRAHPTKRLHAKLYIFRPKGFNEHKPGAVITGSSNLTAAGIGVEDQVSNYEFNVLLHDFDDVQFATDEFDTCGKSPSKSCPNSSRKSATAPTWRRRSRRTNSITSCCWNTSARVSNTIPTPSPTCQRATSGSAIRWMP
jgi:phosphatidylserine/phosphatidylglycerophosphate/cardiolipin synthase-like enzyme